MGLQLNIEYADLLQLVQQLSAEELLQLKKDVNVAIRFSQRIPNLICYIVKYFEGLELALVEQQLHGLLYLIDFGHFALHQQSITGFTYTKSNPYPFSEGIANMVQQLVKKEILTTYHSVLDGTYLYCKKRPSSFKSLHLNTIEKETIQKTLDYFELEDELDLGKEIQYHFSWIAAKNEEALEYEKAKFCDFEWLDYFYDKSKEEFEELKRTKKTLNENPEIQEIFRQIQKL